MTEVALARLLANGSSKVCIFLSGGSDGGFSDIGDSGQPYLGYCMLQDYFPLSKNGGSRLDGAMAWADGAPQRGIYLAGAQHSDGSLSIVINPAEVVAAEFAAPANAPPPVLDIPIVLRFPLSRARNWGVTVDGAAVLLKVLTASGQTWGETAFSLHKRVVLKAVPSR